MTTSSETFEYKDRNFADMQGIVVATNSDVFYPTSTTNLLLDGVRKFANKDATTSALDLGDLRAIEVDTPDDLERARDLFKAPIR